MSDPRTATILARRFPAKRAFVTGGASGLGRAIAARLAADGWTLGLLDLSAARLAETADALRAAGATVWSYAGDVRDEGFVTGSVGDFAARAGGLDLMVNNAGVAAAGSLEATSPDDWRWVLDINLLGVVWGCRAAVPHMRAAGSGLILNVASAAGFAAAPLMSAYNAAKSAVVSLSETLAAELEGSGVQVSVAMPGFFRTALLETMRAPPGAGSLARRMMSGSAHDAEAAARALLAGAAAGRLHVVWPARYRLAWRLKRLFPSWFVRRTAALVRRHHGASVHPPPG
jgi:NAD(P)-dependent dehydrogenase (short-subunit alcohol dehydrogenase family)